MNYQEISGNGSSKDRLIFFNSKEITAERWSNYLDCFNDASIYQTWAYGAVRWSDSSLRHCVAFRDGHPIAAAQISMRRVPFVGKIAYISRGPLWKSKEFGFDSSTANTFLYQLRNEFVVKRKAILRISPQSPDDNGCITALLHNNGFRRVNSAQPYTTLVLDLQPSIADLRRNLDQKWRNQLNRAEKEKFTLEHGYSQDLYNIFLSMQKEMLARKKFTPGVDYQEFKQIQLQLPIEQKMRIMVCRRQNKPVACTIVSSIGNTGIYLLGATANIGLRCNGSNLLHWEFIKWLKERSIVSYDLGGINPQMNPGVYKFKKGIAGKSGKQVRFIGTYLATNSAIKHLMAILGESVLQKIKKTRNTL